MSSSMFVLLLTAYLINGVLGWGKRPDASKPYVQLAAPDQIRTLILWTCVCVQCVTRVDGSEKSDLHFGWWWIKRTKVQCSLQRATSTLFAFGNAGTTNPNLSTTLEDIATARRLNNGDGQKNPQSTKKASLAYISVCRGECTMCVNHLSAITCNRTIKTQSSEYAIV